MLCEYKPYEIAVSIYGFDNDTFYRSTGVKDGFTKFESGLKYLHKLGTRVILQCPITKYNKDFISRFKEIATKYGFEWKFASYVFDSEYGETTPKEARLSPEEVVDVSFEDSIARKEFEKEKKKLKLPFMPFEDKCGAGLNNFTINADNSFSFCGVMSEPKFYFNK